MKRMTREERASRMATIRRVQRYLRRYWPLMALSLALAAVPVALTLYVPVLTGDAVDQIVGPGQVGFAAVGSIALTIGVIVGVPALAQRIMRVCNNRVTYCVGRDIRRDAFRRINELPLSYIDSHAHGELVSRVIADVEQIADGLLMGFSQLFTGIMTIIGTLVFMLTVNPLITLVVVAVTPLSLAVASFISKRTYSMLRKQSETRGEQTALIDEFIGEQKLIRAFSYEARAEERFNAVNEKLQKFSLRAVFFSSLTNPCTRFVNAVIYAGVAVSGAFSVLAGGLTVGGLSAFLSYANQYTKPFNEISGVITELQGAFACAARLFELINTPAEVDAAAAPNPAQRNEKAESTGNISFRNVCFSYTPDTELIRDFSLEVKSGMRVAIVGPTGCGKTTLINLLMRFYDVNSGEILIDGVETRTMPRHELRKKFGMVLQETWLQAGTVRQNIAMGRPQAAENEIIAAAKACHAHGFIMRLPKGYDTVLDEAGGSLSQGQKQLLCIARVMLMNPPMLILDEATSSIDTRTELLVQDAFAKLMHGRTSFIVAHRLSTVREADIILVMRSGRIVESGTHDELLRADGFYKKLYESQFAR